MSKKYESVAEQYKIFNNYHALVKFNIKDENNKKKLIITELEGRESNSKSNPNYEYDLADVDMNNVQSYTIEKTSEYGTDATFTIQTNTNDTVTVTDLGQYTTGVKRNIKILKDREEAAARIAATAAVTTDIGSGLLAAAKLKAEQDAAKKAAEEEEQKRKAEAEAAKLKAEQDAAHDAESKKKQAILEAEAEKTAEEARKKADEKRQLTQAYKSAMEAFKTKIEAFNQLDERAKQLKTEAAILFNKDPPTEQYLKQANAMLDKLQSNKNEAELMANDLKDKLEAAGKARDAANSYNTQNQLSGDKAIEIEDANWQNTQTSAIDDMLKGIQTYITNVDQAKKDAANKVKNTYDSAMKAFKTKMEEFNQLDTQATELKKDADALSNTEEDLQKANNMLTQLKGIQTKAKDMTTDLNTKLTDAVNARDAVLPYNSRNKAIKIESPEWKGQQTSDIENIPKYIQEHIANVEKKVNEIKEAVEKEKKVKAIKEINESLTSLKLEIEKETEAKAQVAEATNRVQDAEQKVEKEKKEQDKIQNEIKQIDKKITESESKQKNLNENVKNAQKVYEDAKTELKTLQTDNKELTDIMTKYGITNAVNGNTTLQDKINGLIKEKDTKIKEITAQGGDKKTKQERISTYKTEIVNLQKHLGIAKDASEKKVKEKELAKKMKDKETAIKKLENQVKTEKQTFDKLNGDKTELETKKNKNTTEVESAEKNLETEKAAKEDADQTLKTATEAVTEAKKATTQKIGELEKLLPQGDHTVSALKGNIEKPTVDSIGGIQFTLEQIQNVIDSSKKKGGKTQRRRNPHRSTKKRSHSEKPI